MLLQHILTKDIFLSIFREDQFHRENNVARQLDSLERTFFTGDVRRQAIDRLRAYYGVIGRAADEIADYAEKQQFLKAIYEDFYTAYNPAAADRLGVVYTPNEVVDFIIRGADHLLQKHFGKTLADDNVQILDPATGTGTFITNLINHLPADRLEHKYRYEIHANEVAILPYYIANLNIEYTYQQRTGRYLEFPNLCFVDTLDNLDWEGASGGAVPRQGSFNLGGLSEENWIRIQEQNEKPISVIIGNPPYNDKAVTWNDGSANRGYPEIDRRIRETYVDEGTAQRTHQYDMYKRFIRWASDRLTDSGVIGFVSNRAFLDARQDDGFRKVIAKEFNELWILDLKGNARTSGERRRREGGNIFDDKIRVGVAVYFLLRKQGMAGFNVFYNAVDDFINSQEKVDHVRTASIEQSHFDEIKPDANGNWVSQSNTNFEHLMPLVDRQTKLAKSSERDRAVFRLFSSGVKTDRDEWVFDFDIGSLRAKALFFADTYNALLDAKDESYDPSIKWSRDLRNEFKRGRRIVYSDEKRVRSLYRPFALKHHFADFTMNDVLTRNHYEMFAQDLARPNRLICVRGLGTYKPFDVMATDRLVEHQLLMNMQCLPLYRYTGGWRAGEQHHPVGHRPHQRALPAGMGRRLPRAGRRGRHHRGGDLRLHLRRAPQPRLPARIRSWTCCGSSPACPCTGTSTTGPRWARSYWTCTSGSSPPSPIRWSGTTGRALTRSGPSCGPTSPGGTITLDERTTLAGIPEPRAWEYRLGSRSALEWVLDQYKERKPRDPTIREKFNTYRFSDHKERVIDLLRRVCTVSVATMEIVDSMAHRELGERRGQAPGHGV